MDELTLVLVAAALLAAPNLLPALLAIYAFLKLRQWFYKWLSKRQGNDDD